MNSGFYELFQVNFAEMGHKVIDNTQNTAVQDQLEALKQLKDRLASHTKFGFYR